MSNSQNSVCMIFKHDYATIPSNKSLEQVEKCLNWKKALVCVDLGRNESENERMWAR